MEQINTFILFVLGRALDSVYLSARRPIKENASAWVTAGAILRILVRGDAKFKLNESAGAATTLTQHFDAILAAYAANNDYVLTDEQVSSFNTAWTTFEQALGLDLGRAPIFFVTDKGIYATPALINSAENALVKEVRDNISDFARLDLNQAGRCLAFGTWTASGFHALRAVEKVLREYYELLVKKPSKDVGMKQCVDELTKAGADRKTMAAIDQLRDLHRNPLDHPEHFLDPAEALELFNAATNAISKMARQIAALKKPPSSPTTSP